MKRDVSRSNFAPCSQFAPRAIQRGERKGNDIMKARNLRITSLVMSVILLIGGTGCSNSKKKREAMKNKAEGVVENYLVYLSKGMNDKLSRYCDPKDDPFQSEVSFTEEDAGNEKSASPEILQELWNIYLSKLTFKIGEFELDGDEGKLDVSVNLIDVKKNLRSSINPSTDDIIRYMSEADEYTKRKITFSLDCDTDNETCMINNTKQLYKEVNKQFDILVDLLPKRNKKLDQDLRAFMDHVIEFDTDYLQSDGFELFAGNLDEYDHYSMCIYKEIMSFITYDVRYTDVEERKARFNMTIHTKDDVEAFTAFWEDANNLGPMVEKLVIYGNHAPKDFTGLEDLFPMEPLAPGFHDIMEKCQDKTIEVEGYIQLDDSVPNGFRVVASFSDVFPRKSYSEYMPDSTDDYNQTMYRAAADSLLQKGDLTEKEYERWARIFNGSDINSRKFDDVLKAHGFTDGKIGNSREFKDYTKDGRITTETKTCQSADEPLYVGLQELSDIDTKLGSGELTGEWTGGWVFYEFRGQVKISDPNPKGGVTKKGDPTQKDNSANKKEYYECYVATAYNAFFFRVEDATDADVEEIHQILTELGLD